MKVSIPICTFLIFAFISCGEVKKDKKKDNPITATDKTGVIIDDKSSEKRVDVYFGEDLFTSYIYPDNIMKPCLWPIVTAEGTEITRKYPLKPKKGERADHPHHIGMWMNYGDVNGIDYWGHSEATPEDRKASSGIIRHQEVVGSHVDGNQATLKVKTNWEGGGKIQIQEDISFHFMDRGAIRIIDWMSTLKAQEDIVFNDTKEGMFAIRVSRELELPSDRPLTLTDADGKPEPDKVIDNKLVSGDYLSSEGISGEEVWGTRAKWMKLYGKYKDEKVAVVILDHKKNPGYPAYWHARGYGLFAVNPLGQEVFSEGKEAMNLSLKKGQSARFAFRTLICSGEISDEEINNLWLEFSDLY
ncbi:MAG: PmoA family protein [Arenibacter sp.]|nr:PmoA family protein [Arenibacter sp.]